MSPIGHRLFTDGKTRPVFADADGRQFVLRDVGQPVYGVWLGPVEDGADEAAVVAENVVTSSRARHLPN